MVYFRKIFLAFVFFLFLFITNVFGASLVYGDYTFDFDASIDTNSYPYACLLKCGQFNFFIVADTKFKVNGDIIEFENYSNGYHYTIFNDIPNIETISSDTFRFTSPSFSQYGNDEWSEPAYNQTASLIPYNNQTFENLNVQFYGGNTGNSELNNPSIKAPFITNDENNLATGTFQYLTINSGGYNSTNFKDFYLLTFDYNASDDSFENFLPKAEILITNKTNDNGYSVYENSDGSYLFTLPSNLLKLDFRNNRNYSLKLAYKEQTEFEGQVIETWNYIQEVYFTVTGMTVQDSVDNGFSDIEDDLTSSDIDIDTNLPTDDTTDITSSGFDSIFNTIYNTVSGTNSNPLVITLPFVNKSFTISKQTVYGNLDLGLLGTLINTVWFFVVSVFIVKDISKKINKIKSGEIDNIENDNIKEDML